MVSLDPLAHFLSHLLGVIEGLQGRGVFFGSLRDSVDTASPQGLFTSQVLGSAAQLERALIRERTRSGMRAAAARGRLAGNPGLRGDLRHASGRIVTYQKMSAREHADLHGASTG